MRFSTTILRCALSVRASEQKVVVLDAFKVDGKTKSVTAALKALGAKKALIVDVVDNELLVRGTRNLKSAKWLAPEGLNVYDVLDHETLILTQGALGAVQQALKPTAKAANAEAE